MNIDAKDPRSDKNLVAGGNQATGQQTIGGFMNLAAVDLGNQTGALLTVVAVRATTTFVSGAVSTQALAANSERLAATIVNAGNTGNLYIGVNGASAVAGLNTVAPNAAYNLPVADVAGQTNGIWDVGSAGPAKITETRSS